MHSVDSAADSDRRLQPSVPPHGHILETGISATTAGDEVLNPKGFTIISTNRNLLHITEYFRPDFDFLLRIAEDRNASEIENRSIAFSFLKCFRF
jgi:hypothetical protein